MLSDISPSLRVDENIDIDIAINSRVCVMVLISTFLPAKSLLVGTHLIAMAGQSGGPSVPFKGYNRL